MSAIRLSIIIPFYNVERYIARCLDSVYKQDLPEEEYEVICVDDCSPDNSFQTVKEYEQKHSNLKIVKNNENRKLGGARNAGLEVASGRYIWFLDSDDFIEDNVIGTLCNLAEKEELDVLHFNYENYPDRTPLHQLEETVLMSGPELFFDKRFIWYHDLVTAWRKIYKTSFLLENRIAFAEHIMFEDNDYSILVFAKAMRVRHINLFAYNYCVNPTSITRVSYNSDHIQYWIDLCRRLLCLKDRLLLEGDDYRFQEVIDQFLRNELRLIFKTYKELSVKEKCLSRRVINDNLSTLKEYIPKLFLLKYRLQMI